jgi:CRISPR/Cas system-associated protein Csm6
MPSQPSPSITDVCRSVVHADERLVDFCPARAIGEPGEERWVFLVLTDRRLVVADPARMAAEPEAAVSTTDRPDVSFVMLDRETLRLLLSDGVLNCRFPSASVATTFRRGLLR